MTKINRAKAERTIVNLFLALLRNQLTDPLSPARENINWIRASEYVRDEVIPEGAIPVNTRKRQIIKESRKPDYPMVIVSDYTEKNEVETIKVDTDVHYLVSCELTIRIKDVGDVTRIGNLAGQISSMLKTYRQSQLLTKGISRLEWDTTPVMGYAVDDNEYNEKQILLTFRARFDEWQLK